MKSVVAGRTRCRAALLYRPGHLANYLRSRFLPFAPMDTVKTSAKCQRIRKNIVISLKTRYSMVTVKPKTPMLESQ